MKPILNSMLAKVVATFLLLFLWESTSAQQTIDTLVAYQNYKMADSLLEAGKYKPSITFLKIALPTYKKAKNWKMVSNCHSDLSSCYWRTSDLKKALYHAQSALKTATLHLNKNSIEEANAYDNLGNYYENTTEYDKVFENYKKALTIKQQILPKNHPEIGHSYNNLGVFYLKKDDLQESLEYLEKALAIYLKFYGPDHPKTGTSYNNIGVIYDDLGKYRKALEYYKKDLSISLKTPEENPLQIGYGYINVGGIYYTLKEYDKALDYYEKALKICINENNLYGIIGAYTNLGLLWDDKGEYDKSLNYHKKSLELQFQLYGNEHHEIPIGYLNIGLGYYNKGDFEKAKEYYNQALQMTRTLNGENTSEVVNIYQHFGNLNTQIKEYDIAMEYYKKSLTIDQSVIKKDSPDIPWSYIGIGQVYFEKAMYTKALYYARKGLKAIQNAHGEQQIEAISSYNSIAAIYSKLGKYEEALKHLDQALSINTKKKFINTSEATFNLNKYIDRNALLETLHCKANTLQSLYKETQEKEYFDNSIATYKNAGILIDKTRQSYQNHLDKVTFAKRSKEIYTDFIETLLLAKDALDQKKAFLYAEKSRANTLNELLIDSKAKKIARIPVKLLELEKKLKTNRAFFQSQIVDEWSYSKTDTIKIREYENELFEINKKQDSLFLVLEKDYPKYYRLKHQNDVISISEIQQQLSKNTTLLEFFTSDSITYAFTISKNDITIKKLKTPGLTQQIEQLNQAIVAKQKVGFQKKSYALYEQLIAPIENQLTGDELIIVPDGALWHLNFELLLTKNTSSKSIKNLPFLLKKHAISYANSATLLFKPPKDDTKKSELLKECLAFSFSDSINISKGQTLSLATLRNSNIDLPGTRKEINAIANIIDGEYYYGNQAIETNFKQNANRYNIIHLALHGEVDHKHPENSKLYFTKSKDSIEDNILYSHELFALDIPAELTVLSACNTGSGKIAKGEGIMSLGNAFQYAGTKSLLLTGWEVYDETTPKLMEYFYINLKKGMNKSKALQQAKLKYLKDSDNFLAAPVYWGGFYLVGDPSPIQFKSNANLYWVIGLFILGILVLSLLLYTRKLKKNH
ncbi:tetratricopeptide repeat protein [Aquimarina sp. 2304DJ70-9]|uniref:tetratricopeptide repeat protein n=1 Tax=Aquimarina penaris TaxID=3231044 RepID=UPI0034636BCE